MLQNKEFLDPAGLADYLGVPVRSVYNWRHTGQGPVAHRAGRHLRYRRSDVEAWLASRAGARAEP